MLFSLFVPGTCLSEIALQVTVHGVKGALYDNIMARLRIYRYSQESELSGAEIRRLHQLAEPDMKSALAPYGYYSSEIKSSLSSSDESWVAEYRVTLGEPILISDISVSIVGEGASLPEFAEETIGLKVGEVLNQNLYEQEKKLLLRRAISHGFIDALYRVHEIRINRSELKAEILLELDTGPRYLFGEIESDQQIITDELLSRFIVFKDGDNFSARQLYELQRDLYRSDYFSSVIVDADAARADALRVPVDIELEPLKTYNRYSFGIGYSTDTLAFTRFEWFNRLLNTRGHRASSSLMIGQLESYLLLNYRVPVRDPRYNTLSGSTIWRQKEWEDTATTLYGAGLAYEYSTPEHHYGLSLDYQDEDYRVGDTRGTSQLLMPGVQWSWALADDIVNTKNGIRTSIEILGAQEGLFSDATFLKVRADGKAILSLIEGLRLIGRGSIGTIVVDSIDSIPPSLRFYAGGEKSVRGYKYRSLGTTDSSGTVIGGRFLLTGGIEIEKRFTDIWRGVLFYDAGNAMDDPNVDLAHGVGAGIGLALPFGQARLEFAYPLSAEGESQYVYLSLGADL